MKPGTHYAYRTCSSCGRTLPLNREFFRRTKIGKKEDGYHSICRECENEEKKNKEWQNGKLLCHNCGEYKDETEFSPNGGAYRIRKHRRNICKTCATQRQRAHLRELKDEPRLVKCINSRYLGAKDRSEQHGYNFNITLPYLLRLWDRQKGKCALSGIEMTYDLKKGRTPTNLSLDRIDRAKGYTVGNVQFVCMACNQIKSDMDDDTMYYFCKKIVEQYEDKNKEITSAA